jgi:crotonobetainyl-CoA:carnitine CoA-transferase CaiB-like acyl-CoA transferase
VCLVENMDEYCTFPMRDGERYIVAREDAIYYGGLFPALNIGQEFCCMETWLEANPSRRKTRRGIKRFIANWLIKSTREQCVPSRVAMEAAVGRHE